MRLDLGEYWQLHRSPGLGWLVRPGCCRGWRTTSRVRSRWRSS